MKKFTPIILISCVFFAIFTHATEATPTSATPPQLTTCIPCHGDTGNSTVPEWPKLAGQHANYLVKQLVAFKMGENNGRVNASMNSTVTGLSNDDMMELAKFYEAQSITPGSTPKKYLDLGQQVYRGGNAQKHLASCIGCHGPRGTGNKLANIPRVSSQHAAYTILQLKAYRDKSRQSANHGMMNDIAAKMTDEEITAVAHYLAGLN